MNGMSGIETKLLNIHSYSERAIEKAAKSRRKISVIYSTNLGFALAKLSAWAIRSWNRAYGPGYGISLDL